jgi:hypothetical protein
MAAANFVIIVFEKRIVNLAGKDSLHGRKITDREPLVARRPYRGKCTSESA